MSQNNFLVYQLLFNGKSYYNQSTTPTTKHLIIQDWQVDWHVNLHEEITKFLLAFLVSWLSYRLINGWLYESFCCPPTEDVCTLVSSSLYINGVSSFRCKRNFSLATHVLDTQMTNCNSTSFYTSCRTWTVFQGVIYHIIFDDGKGRSSSKLK